MGEFKIPKMRSTTNKTIRFSNDITKDIRAAICGKDCTFSVFVIVATKMALVHLKKNDNKS